MRLIEIKCPTCGEEMEVDLESGKVLSHGESKKDMDLTNVAESLKEQANRRSELFQISKKDEKTKSERLDKLFSKEEKRIREEKDYGKFVRDIDLD